MAPCSPLPDGYRDLRDHVAWADAGRRSTVLVWLRKHGRQGWGRLVLSGICRSDPMSKEDQVLSPDQRIKELEVQLKEAQEKAQLFEAMLDVIRKEYGVKLPKKRSGGFSSKSE